MAGMRKGDTYWHNLDVWERFFRRLFGWRRCASVVQQFRVREDGQLENGNKEKSRAPNEVAEKFNKEHPRPFLE